MNNVNSYLQMSLKGIPVKFLRQTGNRRVFEIDPLRKNWFLDLKSKKNKLMTSSEAFKINRGKVEMEILPAAKMASALRKTIRNSVGDRYRIFIKVSKIANGFQFQLRDAESSSQNSNQMQTSMLDFFPSR